MTDIKKKASQQIQEHYSVNASTYRNHYNSENLWTSPTYPAEYFRLELLLKSLKDTGALRVLDAGCGEGTPMLKVSQLGIEVRGFDFTSEMIDEARLLFKRSGLDPNWLMVADVEDFDSFSPLIENESFDATVCFGVMPHVSNVGLALKNLKKSLKTGARAYVEFRNPLFDLITMNRFTHAFITEELLHDVPDIIRQSTGQYLENIFAMDKPPLRKDSEAGKPGYDAIQAKRHNPLTINKLFIEAGFADPKIHWYHYHPTLPLLEGDEVESMEFRKAAVDLELKPDDWRGHFLCSAYVIEATAI
jgi:2-polyprenyl-3-methyl-5-hydroxy-6-metoxy-1,4-benzoquinol methylase